MARPSLVRLAMTAAGVLSGNVSTPSAGLRDDGYTDGDKPLAEHHNWFFGGISQWLRWIDGMWPVEHDDDGHHTEVHAQQGVAVEASYGVWYEQGLATPGARTQWIDLGNPAISPWVIRSGTPVLNPAATPPNTSVAPGGTVVATRDITQFIVGQDDASAGDQWVAVELGATGKRVNSADALVLTLHSIPRDGSGPESAALATYTKATNAAYQQTDTTISVSVDPSKFYIIKATITVDGGSAAGDAGLCNARIGVDRSHLE